MFFASQRFSIPRQSTESVNRTPSHIACTDADTLSAHHTWCYTLTRGSSWIVYPKHFLIPSLVSRHVSRPAKYTKHFVFFFTFLYFSFFHRLRPKVDHVQTTLSRLTNLGGNCFTDLKGWFCSMWDSSKECWKTTGSVCREGLNINRLRNVNRLKIQNDYLWFYVTILIKRITLTFHFQLISKNFNRYMLLLFEAVGGGLEARHPKFEMKNE